MASTLTASWKKWLRTAKAVSPPILLGSRHIYILPTRAGLLFAGVLVAMLLGAINYSLSLAFMLTFLLAGMGVLVMLHTWRNLAYLSITSSRGIPAFAGESATIELTLNDTRRRDRYAIAAYFEGTAFTYADIDAGDSATLMLPHPTVRRGWLVPGRITFFTVFPLGLFYAWAYAEPGCKVLVYPEPAASGAPIPATADQGGNGSLSNKPGDQDFAGLRGYQPGDSPKRIDWKASSREQGMYTKQFQGEAQSHLWLDWSYISTGDTETRLSQLTRWVIDAHAAHETYGLRLPGINIQPGNDEHHYRQCLQALALWGLPA